MEYIKDYIISTNSIIDEWKLSKNNITSKIKIVNENQTSIEILERNLGENNLLQQLKEDISSQSSSINDDLDNFNKLTENITSINSECLLMLTLLLDLYSKIKIETAEKCENEIINDPISIEVAKLIFPTTDNLQLRGDPSICGILKDDFRKAFDNEDKDNKDISLGSISYSNILPTIIKPIGVDHDAFNNKLFSKVI